MSDEVLVSVEGVSKKFCRSLKRSLWYGVQDVGSELLGRKGRHDELRKNEFWAVNDVSFELKRGECLGLIGPNGAGKSTLLKMLNGLVKPDRGRITMRGRVGALIELGAGFNPILTGRENVYVNGSVLGFSKKEIDRKFDAIVDFAEIEEFIDTPVQNYSSGMNVRLGFAVAAQMEPQVLLIDEVLAVGDVGFRGKCFNRIGEIQRECAIILVSHQMSQVGRLCDRVHVMNRGLGTLFAAPEQGIRMYLNQVARDRPVHFFAGARIIEGSVSPADRTLRGKFPYGCALEFSFEVEFVEPADDVTFNFHILDSSSQYIYQANSLFDEFQVVRVTQGCFSVSITTPQLKLSPGHYSCAFAVRANLDRTFLAWAHGIVPFEIEGLYFGVASYLDEVKWELSAFRDS